MSLAIVRQNSNFSNWCGQLQLDRICQSASLILVQNNQSSNHARHPATKREQKHDEHRAAAAVVHRQGREDDGEDDLEAGHFFKVLSMRRKYKYFRKRNYVFLYFSNASPVKKIGVPNSSVGLALLQSATALDTSSGPNVTSSSKT